MSNIRVIRQRLCVSFWTAFADDGAIDIAWGVDADGWGNEDITISNSLLHDNQRTMLIKYGPHRNITLYNNLFAHNNERNPQVRGTVENLQIINNVMYQWANTRWGYGLRYYSQDTTDEGPGGSGKVNMNVIGNQFIAGASQATPLAIEAQEGTVGGWGDIWFEDNVYPGMVPASAVANTVNAAIPMRADAQVTIRPSSQVVAHVLSSVGTHYRTAEENDIIAGIDGTRPNPPVIR